MFDVGVRESRQRARYFRVHDTVLSRFILRIQLRGFLVFSVIPLFRPKEEESEYSKAGLSEEKMREVREQVDPIDDRCMIDPHGM